MTPELLLRLEEFNEAVENVEGFTNDIEQAVETLGDLNEIHDTAEEANESPEGASPLEIQETQARLERIYQILGMEPLTNLKLESYGGKTKFRTEGIKEFIQWVIDKIVESFKWLKKTFFDMTKKADNLQAYVKKRVEELEKVLEEKKKGNPSPKSDLLTSYGLVFSADGEINVDTITESLSEINLFKNFTKEAEKKFEATFAIKDVPQGNDEKAHGDYLEAAEGEIRKIFKNIGGGKPREITQKLKQTFTSVCNLSGDRVLVLIEDREKGKDIAKVGDFKAKEFRLQPVASAVDPDKAYKALTIVEIDQVLLTLKSVDLSSILQEVDKASDSITKFLSKQSQEARKLSLESSGINKENNEFRKGFINYQVMMARFHTLFSILMKLAVEDSGLKSMRALQLVEFNLDNLRVS